MKKFLIISLLTLCLTTTLASAQALTGKSSNDKPVQIDATDGIEWDRNAQTYTAKGTVVAKQDETTLYTDLLTANYRDTKGKPANDENQGNVEIYKFTANGNVRINTPQQDVYGDQGVYTLDDGIFRVTGGNLRLQTKTELVTAQDSLEYHGKEQVAYANGNATILREKNKLQAATLKAYFENDAAKNLAIKDIYAKDNVIITTPTEVATGAKGHYDAKTGIVTLIDKVSIKRGDNQLYGDMAEVNLKTGISKLLSKPNKTEKGRVQALFKKDNKGQ